MNVRSVILCLAMSCTSALAETPLDAEGFDRLTLGKTFTYGNGETPYGAEEYLPNRRVRWSFLDGRCIDGHWFESKGHICFVYENDPEQHCWDVFKNGGSLRARIADAPDLTPLYELEQSTEPLYCMGPDVGV